jgi:HEAT repeat protein
VQIRLEAGQALAMLRTDGLEKDAEALTGDATPRGITNRLVAAALLRRHGSAEAIRLLQRLAQDKEPTVAAAAAGRLLEVDAELLVPGLDYLLASPDDNLRSLAVEVLYRKPVERHVHLLGARLEDTNPDVRNKAQRYLQELGKKAEFRDAIIADGTRVLGSKDWWALEQAIILLTILDHKPAAARFVELLKFERPEVFLTAAWGLRRLAVADTFPAVTKHIEAQFQRIAAPWSPSMSAPNFRLIEHQVSQLNQLLGQQKYLPAEPLLRKFIARRAGNLIDEARASAIWALGLIHEGKPDAGLAKALAARLNASPLPPSEDYRVRLMSAIALGRMGSKESVPALREHYSEERASGDPLHDASGWAIEQITGEKMGPPATIRYVERDWFLMPHKEESGQETPFAPARTP